MRCVNLQGTVYHFSLFKNYQIYGFIPPKTNKKEER